MTAALDPAITNMEGDAALPRDNGELVFASPWEGRSLAMAIALVDALGLQWDEFRFRLMEEIAAEPDRPYYESWTAALESLVVTKKIADADELRQRSDAAAHPG